MHPRILASRSDAAQARILAAAQQLAARAGLEGAAEKIAAAKDRDPQVSRMQEREAIADLLEALCAPREQPNGEDAAKAAAMRERMAKARAARAAAGAGRGR